MTSSQLRTNARESLKGKWGKAILTNLVYLIIYWAICFVANLIPILGPIILFVISLPLSYGILVSFIKLKRNEEILSYADFLSWGFEAFGKVWSILGNIILKMIVPIVLIIIFIMLIFYGLTGSIIGITADSINICTGFSSIAIIGIIGYIGSLIYAIIKGYLYCLSFYILYDNPNKSGKEIVEESERLMNGNRCSFFWLGLTFIGWSILASLTFGIGMLWLIPYMSTTFICFYESLVKTKNDNIEVTPINNK